ncbi:DUF4249 domain-containing protein [Pontibacter cellulosilyticus]|uniref:DUF4249 domain-containing protein n=1 Tax=Pontibacter cellulosilyticus TaxID=1720253 RepID=A0A923SJC1_9BACT|nr:DUF4249 domain-containing protein [Pontibacter cellulosilyticus]MBC5992561.1 DUF4249 domain-containing protein [Pontibacter cellulosilyticus]
MKLHRYILAGLMLFAAALQSCEKEVADFDISTKPMLVATAFISPQDTALAVEVKRTQPAIGKQLQEEELRVKDATVTISDGTNTVQLTYNTAWNKYFGSIKALPVVANKSYFLKVTTPAGEKAEATCTVPSREGIQVTELNYNTRAAESYGYKFLEHKIDFKWQDKPGIENYYHLTSYRTYSVSYGYPPIVEKQHESAYTDSEKIFVSDAKHDGKVIQSPEFKITSMDPDVVPKPFVVTAIISVTDKPYYLYHKSVMEQESVGGNPFAEPKRIYTNIQGGLGVFAAYNQIKVQKQIQ